MTNSISYVTWACYSDGKWASILDKVTHVIAPSIVISSATNPTLIGMYSGNISATFPDIVSKAHVAGVKALPYLFSNSSYVTLAQVKSAGKVQALCENLKNLVDQFNLDGIDIDLEESMPAGGLDAFVKQLRATLGPGKLITHAGSGYGGMKLSAASINYVDMVNPMCYDMWGYPDQTQGYPQGNYEDSIKACLRWTAAGWPKEKINLLAAFYGSSQGGGNHTKWKDIVARYPTCPDSQDVFKINNLDTEINNVDTIKKKAQWCKDNLGGIGYFACSYDVFESPHSLLDAAWSVIKPVPTLPAPPTPHQPPAKVLNVAITKVDGTQETIEASSVTVS